MWQLQVTTNQTTIIPIKTIKMCFDSILNHITMTSVGEIIGLRTLTLSMQDIGCRWV